MQSVRSLADQIHERAVELSRCYRKAEVELIEILDQVEQCRVYLRKGHASLFRYCVSELGLSESVAYNLIVVSRKAREVPELKAKLQAGAITLSNARLISAILNAANQGEWLEKAATLSHRQLEKEVVKVRPQVATPERASYVTESRIKLELGLFEKDMMMLRRVQDLLSQARARAVSLEETLVTMSEEYLKRHDPIARARRQWVKNGSQTDLIKTPVTLQVPGKRMPIPAAVLHQIMLRDRGRCAHINDRGERCNQSRWIEIHHRIPVSRGGPNTLQNLITLCAAHHDWVHLKADTD